MWLTRYLSPHEESTFIPANIKSVKIIKGSDVALLKLDFADHEREDWLMGRDSFPYIEISTRVVEEGEPIYAYGYPLNQSEYSANAQVPPEVAARLSPGAHVSATSTLISPRVTSAIISCHQIDIERFDEHATCQQFDYLIDKSLNYGNSGGPIIATQTGKVFGVCSRFQAAIIPQQHLGPTLVPIMIPSLYGFVSKPFK